ncbi:hypothetical protein SAMN05444422_1244 [Halobiforma haloterrestris]|uniref:Uncharacterized protein n=1 Tax=Natronobacterium haloterrestre TaxID=148448 RepID=A0A1I1M0F0_NATHA|nr:hypothetical protein [Halobiforma haloterrestris]SFC76678.1 hypothetical protein SAMN05444422_1244 [Halobiforma haloterrestris]
MIDSLEESPERLPTVSEFEAAIKSLKTAIEGLPTSASSFQDQSLDFAQLRDGTEGPAQTWQEIESVVRSQFDHHQLYSVDREDGSVRLARAIGRSPEAKQPIINLEVEFRKNGKVSVVSSYYLDGEEYPFFLGEPSSATNAAVVAAELTAYLTFITAIKKGEENHSSPISISGSAPEAHQQMRNELDTVCEQIDPAREVAMRLKHRPEWRYLDTPMAQRSSSNTHSTSCQTDGGESVQCLICGDVPVQGPTLKYKNWEGKLMFCEPCLRLVKRSIEEEQTILEAIADDLG